MIMTMTRVRRTLLLAGVLLAASAAAAPCAKNPQVLRVLFIGNSYTYVNDLPRLTRDLAASAGKRVETDMVAEGGATLGMLFRKGAAVAKIRQGCWDDVVLQEQSVIDGYIIDPNRSTPDAFYQAVRAFDKEVRAQGAKTVLFITWKRFDLPVHQDLLYAAYLKMARETGAQVAPVGQAWDTVLKERGGMVLHAPDKSHPSLAGSYLSACVFYSVLFGKSPEGLAAPQGLSKEDAAFLQRSGWKAVQ
jgi:hypothetical protein